MIVRLLGSMLCLALFAAWAIAQNAHPSTTKPPAQPPVPEALAPPAPLPPPITDDHASGTTTEPPDSEKPGDDKSVPA